MLVSPSAARFKSFLAPNPLLGFPWSLLPLTARVTLGKPATLFWGDPCEIRGEGAAFAHLPGKGSRGLCPLRNNDDSEGYFSFI